MVAQEWEYVETLLPEGWQYAAWVTGAIVRRRVVRTASALLRLVMAYSVCGLSLREAAAWAGSVELARLSDVAILKRLRKCGDWLAALVTMKLTQRAAFPRCSRLRIRLVDASCISRPGDHGDYWRLHLSFDLSGMRMEQVELTGKKEGETLCRFDVSAGEVVVCDRGYAKPKDIWTVVSKGADIIVRLCWNTVPLVHRDGMAFDIIEHLSKIEGVSVAEFEVATAPRDKDGIGSVFGRLIALRKSQEAADAERRRIRQDAKRKGKTPRKESLEAAGYVFVFTTLPEEVVSAEEVLEIYRFRWQIELVFKQLKSWLHIDQMNAKCDELCRTFLLGKILGALLLEDLAHGLGAFSPWGYGQPSSLPKENSGRAYIDTAVGSGSGSEFLCLGGCGSRRVA